MPAAAVIPAPIAYIKVVAVKKLVVGFGTGVARSAVRSVTERLCHYISQRPVVYLTVCGTGFGTFTLKKLECSKQAFQARIHEHGIME